jgi:hypothetical protein
LAEFGGPQKRFSITMDLIDASSAQISRLVIGFT